MLDCHVNAFLIKPGRVLGRKLKPLTLAHYWLLEAVESPYVCGMAPTYKDTVFAVFLLSMRPPTARWMLMRPRLMRLVFSTWGHFNKSLNIVGDMRAFQEYWDAYTARPNAYESAGKSRASCLPTSIKLAWALMGKVGERRAWSLPLPLALAYYTAEAEWNGTEYVTEHDKHMAKLNAELAEQHAKKQESANG
jgi:hypothetical protein